MELLAVIRRHPWAAAHGVLLGLFAYTLWVLHSYFYSGQFGFHDVTLTNSFLASYVHGLGFFWIPDYGMTHFKVHFTPTLALLGPFYWLWNTQFLLLSLSAVALYSAIWCTLAIYRAMIDTAFADAWARRSLAFKVLMPITLVVVMGLNLYTKSVVLSANAWLFYLPVLALTVLLLLRGAPLWAVIAAALLALGVRQDAGLYLVFQVGSLWFFPVQDRTARRRLRRNIAVVVALAVAYVGLVVLVAMPSLGAVTHVERGWHQYGDSWTGIATTFITKPWLLGEVFKNSAFADLNSEYLWLSIFSPVAFVFNNLPGALLYACDDLTKRFLEFYNANYLLVGMGIGMGWGCLRLVSFRLLSHNPWFDRLLCLLMVGVTFWEFNHVADKTKAGFAYVPPMHSEATEPFRQQLAFALESCPNLARIAADYKNIVFLPNNVGRYIIQNYRKADAVVMQMGKNIRQPGFPSSEDTAVSIQSEGEFELKADNGDTRYYLHKGFQCTGK